MSRPTKKFIPEICKPKGDTPAAYEGYVVISVPDYDQRNAFFMIDEFDDMIDEAARAKREGSTDADVADKAMKTLGTKRTIALMSNIKKQLPDWVVEINIKRLDDGFIFNNLDDVRMDGEVGAVTQDMVNELIGKYRVGNPNMQPS